MKEIAILTLCLCCLLWRWPFVCADLNSACSKQTCDSVSTEKNQTSLSSIVHSCSCSKSCALFGDCCHDSPHRTADVTHIRPKLCVAVKDKGNYQAIAGCSEDWPYGSRWYLCTEFHGHSPVTSRETGTTYLNIYCAMCNRDSSNLQNWDVEAKCCREHESDVSGRRTFIYKDNSLFSRLRNHDDCPCPYHSTFKNFSFLNGLELRPCFVGSEKSTCSFSWSDETHRTQCRSFLDPVYNNNVVYRNKYCGICNYIKENALMCVPEVIEDMFKEGMSLEDVYKYCSAKKIEVCLHYLESSGPKGRPQAANNVIRVSEFACMPPSGRRCCQGYRFDFTYKKCRPLSGRGR